MENYLLVKNINWINQYLKKHKKLDLSQFLGWSNDSIITKEGIISLSINQVGKLHKQLGLSLKELMESDVSNMDKMRWLQFNTSEEDNLAVANQFLEIPLNNGKAGASNFSAVKAIKNEDRHLAKICVPANLFDQYNSKRLKAFEIEGFSMYPLVRSGDVVIAERLINIMDFKEGDPYILLLKDGGIFFKRLFKVRNERMKIQLLSDNPEFPQITLATNAISECWKVCHQIKSTEF